MLALEVGACTRAEPGMESGWRNTGADENELASRALKVTPSDRRVEELKRKRRQEQVSQARLMLEFVGKNERLELTTMFPELLQSSDVGSSPDEEPKARIFVGPDVVSEPSPEASLLPLLALRV